MSTSSAGKHGRSSLQPVRDLLRDQQPELLISRQKLEPVRGIELVRIRREQQNQELCFSSRPFVLCGLPVRRLPKDQLLYERRNGQFILQVTGHPEFGVPFGQDRLVPIFLATLAVQQKSRTGTRTIQPLREFMKSIQDRERADIRNEKSMKLLGAALDSIRSIPKFLTNGSHMTTSRHRNLRGD